MAVDWQDSVPPDWPKRVKGAWLERKGDPPPDRVPHGPNGGVHARLPYTAEWSALCKALSEEKGWPICGARGKGSGWPCLLKRKSGMNRCGQHGGGTPVGPASPQWKDGRFSYHVPGDLAETYTKALEDPDYLSLKKEIALASTRHQQLLDRLAEGESQGAWNRVEGLAGDLALAMAEGDSERVTEISSELSELAEQGLADYVVWRELRENAEHIRRLRNTDRLRMEALQQYLSAERGTAMIARVLGMLRNIVDREQLHTLLLQMQAEGLVRPLPTHRGALAPHQPVHINGGGDHG